MRIRGRGVVFWGFVVFLMFPVFVFADSNECAAGLCKIPDVPELVLKVREARALLAEEPLEKEIESIPARSPKPKPKPKPKSKKKRAVPVSLSKTKRAHRLTAREFLFAVEDEEGIKKILFRETLPSLGSSGFVFEIIDSDFACELSVEHIGGMGISRRYFVTCEDENEKMPVRAVSYLTFPGKNLFSSRDELEGKIRRITYSPFAEEYATSEMVAYGDLFVQARIESIFGRLRDKKVFSQAYPGRLVSEAHNRNTPYILYISEHGDHDEFDAWGPEFLQKKVLTTTALNEGGVYPTTNRSGAAGPMQITDNRKKIKKGVYRDGTYTMVRRVYPEADLIPEFPAGVYDFENALTSAVLLLDYELSNLPQWVRDAYEKDPRSVVLCLAAAYHSGGGVAADLCGKPTKAVSLDEFQYPKRFQKIASTKKTRGQKGKPQLEYYLRKFIALEKLNHTIEAEPL